MVTFIFTFFVYVFTNNNGLALHRRYNVEIYNLEVLKWQKIQTEKQLLLNLIIVLKNKITFMYNVVLNLRLTRCS